MVSIVVCDDHNDFRDDFCGKIHKLATSMKAEHEIFPFSDGQQLTDAVKRGLHIDILFLDIHMPGINGKEIAGTLRVQNKRFQLVFVSSYEDEVWETFEYDVAEFVRKSEVDYRLPLLLHRLITDIQAGQDEILVVHAYEGRIKNRITLYRADIMYFETQTGSRDTLIHVSFQPEPYPIGRMALRDIHEKISSSGFMQTDRSYIVNLACVRAIDRHTAIMENGVRIPLSRRRRASFEKAFFEHLSTYSAGVAML